MTIALPLLIAASASAQTRFVAPVAKTTPLATKVVATVRPGALTTAFAPASIGLAPTLTPILAPAVGTPALSQLTAVPAASIDFDGGKKRSGEPVGAPQAETPAERPRLEPPTRQDAIDGRVGAVAVALSPALAATEPLTGAAIAFLALVGAMAGILLGMSAFFLATSLARRRAPALTPFLVGGAVLASVASVVAAALGPAAYDSTMLAIAALFYAMLIFAVVIARFKRR